MDLDLTFYPALRDIAALEANWDSYGAVPIDRRCLEHALFFMKNMGMWTPVPCSDGSIQLERHAGGMDMELHISVAVSASAEGK